MDSRAQPGILSLDWLCAPVTSWPWQDIALGWRDFGCGFLVGCASQGPVEQGMEIPVLSRELFPPVSLWRDPITVPSLRAALPAPWDGRKCN